MRQSAMKGACKGAEFSSLSIAIPRMKLNGPKKSWSAPALRIFHPRENPPQEAPRLTKSLGARMAETINGPGRKVGKAFLSFPYPMQLFEIRLLNGRTYVED